MQLISVIVPIYNAAEYLPRCIDSILNQTHRELELILVNDGSTDGSGEICDEYVGKDKRIKVIHQKNSGVGAARNAGMDAARGEWFGFVDSDDYIEPQMYEKLLTAALAHNKKLACCGHFIHTIDGAIYCISDQNLPEVMTLQDVLKYRFVHSGGFVTGYSVDKLYHRSFIEGSEAIRFDTAIHRAEDILFGTQAFLRCDGVAYVAEALYNYVRRDSSATGSGISEKTMTRYIARKRTLEIVQRCSPSLRPAMRCWYTKGAYNWLQKACSTKEDYRFIPSLKKETRRYAISYMLSKTVSVKNKVKYLAYATAPITTYELLNKKSKPTLGVMGIGLDASEGSLQYKNGKEPLISIIVPIYNTAEYLPRCIDSILYQTHGNLEIILINDGSTDESGEICDRYAKKDKRVTVIHQENMGQTATRNVGIDAAKGEWIGQVDPDDYIDLQMYEKLLSAAITNGTLVASCGFSQRDVTGRVSNKVNTNVSGVVTNVEYLESRFSRNVLGGHWCKLFHRSIFEGEKPVRYDPECHTGADKLFEVEVMLKIDRLTYVPEALYHYCMREGNTATSIINADRMTMFVSFERIDELLKPRYPALARKAKINCAGIVMKWLSRMKNSNDFDNEYLPILRRKAWSAAPMYLLASYAGRKEKVRYIMTLLCPNVRDNK